MNLYDEKAEYAFSGTEFTNIGKNHNPLFDYSKLTINFKGLFKTEDESGITCYVIRLVVLNMRSTEAWLCYSFLLNDDDEYYDDFQRIEPNKEQTIDISIECHSASYSDNRRARLHFVIEDGRRRILGRCDSVCVDYNIFSGRYQYQKICKFSKGKRREYRELDIRVNKMTERRFISNDWSYAYIKNTIPIVITNCTDRRRAFTIETIEFDDKPPDDIIGINDLTDAITIGRWDSCELNIVVPQYYYFSLDPKLYFVFTDLATNNRYMNAYTFNEDSKMCLIDYSVVFIHDGFQSISTSSDFDD